MMRALLAMFCMGSLACAAAGDPAVGSKLVAERQCETCHTSKTPADAKAVYTRKDRKVTSLEKLKAQVALCNSELNLQMFPDEEEHVVAWLDHEYYHFTSPGAPSPSGDRSRTR